MGAAIWNLEEGTLVEAETVVGRWVDTTLGQKGRGHGRAIPPQRGGWRGRFVVSIAAVAVVLAAVGGLTSASASTGVVLVVDSTADAVDGAPGDRACATAAPVRCTLRAAVQESNALAGADTISIPAGIYELAIPPLNQNLDDTGDLDVTGSLTVSGAGSGSTVVDGGIPVPGAPVRVHGLDRLFEVVADGGEVSFSGLTFRDGYAAEYGGALMNNSTAKVTVADSILTGNVADKAGGAIDNHLGGTVEVRRSTLTNNVAFESGSALNNQRDGTLTIEDTHGRLQLGG